MPNGKHREGIGFVKLPFHNRGKGEFRQEMSTDAKSRRKLQMRSIMFA